jgi:sugar lactone lactonase YvrE
LEGPAQTPGPFSFPAAIDVSTQRPDSRGVEKWGMPMRAIVTVILVLLILAAGALTLTPIPIKPEAWTPPPVPAPEGAYAENTSLKDGTTRLGDKLGHGPEDVAVRDGFAYTGLEDGRIMKVALDGSSAVPYANTGGRPLGLQFDASGNLIVADAVKGLVSVAPDGTVRVLTDSVDGQKMIFVDDLDIAADGKIWFSDASTRFGIKDFINDLWEGSATGRLLSYDPASAATKIELDGLRFANGVALATDQSFVLVNETAARRIKKLWIAGPNAGKAETLIDGLPGFPDNLSRAPDGNFWVALPSKANPAFDQMMERPFLRGVMFRLTQWGLMSGPVPEPRGWAIKIDANGAVLKNLMDPKGESYHTITSVNEFDGKLYFGSIQQDSMGVMAAPQ